MCGNAAAMPYSTPLMLMSMVRFQSSIFRRSSGECGMTPALLRITSTRPYCLTAAIDERLDLRRIGHVSDERGRLPASFRDFVDQRLKPLGAPRSQHHVAPRSAR